MPKGIFLYGKDDLAGLKWVRTHDKSIFSHNNHKSETPNSVPQSQRSDNLKVTASKQFLLFFFLSLIKSLFQMVQILGWLFFCLNILNILYYSLTCSFWGKVGCNTLSEKAMAPHSSTLAWKIPWTEEPGGLLSMGH